MLRRLNRSIGGADTRSVTLAPGPAAAPSDEVQKVVYALSHDLRAPLRHIRGFVDELGLELGDAATDGVSDSMQRVVAGVDALQERLDALSDYARITRSPGAVEPCNTGQLVADLIDELAADLDAVGATVGLGSLPVVTADRVQLVFVFRELLTNALKFGGEGVNVRIWAEVVDDRAHMAVADDGAGVRTGNVDVFDLFRRCHGRAFPGSGVGLAAVRRIVADLGGAIELTSERGAGTTVRFALPMGGGPQDRSST